MAVTQAGAASVMNSYSDVDGVPAGADGWLLTDLLRGEWGFDGTVVSDYWAVPFLASMHRVARDADDAGALALEAGSPLLRRVYHRLAGRIAVSASVVWMTIEPPESSWTIGLCMASSWSSTL